ncbi:methyltransferase [Nitrosomonas ureae]|uniref:methyltransferase n=1 Tax=Nitrosomonas ureae TaxID=44577 RepID=UPI000BE27D57|nr:class I SAM-dependent methyltransferase [Nitrosomonas ureae]
MKTSTAQTLAELNATGSDFEWYPTTNEIISAFHRHANHRRPASILDIGAGNGKVLTRFKELNERGSDDHDHYHTEYFAIEKARPLLDSLPVDVGILGTDFWEQSLLDKSVDCIFSNPPYSEFVEWSVKVIREANANYIYLVIPQRWKNQQPILNAIEARKATYEVIGEFDFLSSEDRTARTKVDLVFISLCDERYRSK